MSSPVSPEVYRRRRLVVLVATVALIAIVWWLAAVVFGGDDQEPAAAGSTEPTATPEPTEELEPGTAMVSLAAGDGICDPENVRITPSVRPDQAAGAPVVIDLAVSAAGTAPCTLVAKDADLVVVISQDGAPVYDSTACAASLLTEPVMLSPDWATVTSVTWDGRASGATCTEAEPFTGSGEYTIQLGTLGGEPGETPFTLTEPAPEPAPGAEPAPDDAAPEDAAPEDAAPEGGPSPEEQPQT